MISPLSDLPGTVRDRAIDRFAFAHDASHYLLIPEAVVSASNLDEVSAILRATTGGGSSVTFRSGGTSLSGQSQSDSLLVETRGAFRGIEILDDGQRVRVQPGATVRSVNTRLARFGRKLGPDPASEAACTIGGVIANNSSGMSCGTEFNSYRTIESLVLVLPSGTIVDTADPDADARLRDLEPSIHAGLARLRDRVRGNESSVRIIRQQFAMKNTMGYSLNSFLDFTDPIDILTHLVVGSEGTLAFVGEATFRTISVRPHVATGFLLFESLRAATDALESIVDSRAAAIELLDETSLRVARLDPASATVLPAIDIDHHAGLLVEYQEMSTELLAGRVEEAQGIFDRFPLATAFELSGQAQTRADLWHMRKGLYATVAGNRPSGTTALLEDVAVPVPALASTCGALLELFDRHRYEDSVIFGHAKDGNIHFLLNERFDDPACLERYIEFTDEMVDLVLGAGGTLKAEHGTGRIMAPFVRRQFGDELYEVMVEIKALLDPQGLLNPGVIISADDTIHISHLKTTPTVEVEVDRCVECGYCEPVCPSKDLTLTPRQRIVVRREMARASKRGETELLRELTEQFEYDGIDTCAADGMCATSCPVLIDTGSLVKRLRAQEHKPLRSRLWLTAARHWSAANSLIGRTLSAAAKAPAGLVIGSSSAARRVLGAEAIPQWDSGLPRGGQRRRASPVANAVAVFVPSCVGAMFGPDGGSRGASAAFLALCERAGIPVTVPAGIDATCCGTPWKSKGMTEGYRVVLDCMSDWLWEATDAGRLPVVCDASSCTEGLRELVHALGEDRSTRIEVIDAVQFTAEVVLPRLPEPARIPSLVVHPTCSSTRLGLDPAVMAVASAAAAQVAIPEAWGCCAFAGDRGMLHPELTASATAAEVAWLGDRSFDAYASCNRMCEIGMTRATGQPYRHVLEVLAQAVDAAGAVGLEPEAGR